MRDIRIETRQIKSGIELTLDGELLFYDSQDFMLGFPELVHNQGRFVVLNMKKLRAIDSAGLGAILYVSEACRMQYQTLQIINADMNVLTLLRTIKNVGTFELVEGEEL